ncbi:MAG: HAMP domain-containing histidine kinase [Clostridia bacterium]|nr:HAMP domain-containing histidine kinase [Clostridia bacterium]
MKKRTVQEAATGRVAIRHIIRRQKESRKSLTLLFAGLTYIILLAIAAVVAGLIYALAETGVLEKLTQKLLVGGAVALLTGVSLVIGAGITYFLGRMMMKPMNHIINTMNALASGNFKARLKLKGPLASHPTVREVTDSFNDMAAELEHTEILRTDFVNDFSHEFKTPIVSIAGFAKLLKRSDLSEEQKAEYTDIIVEESMRLSSLATSVLNLSKIENQTILTGQTEFNLAEQIRGCILLFEEKWTLKELELDLSFDEIRVEANEELLKQVWINLLDNAVKFADAHGTVGVSLHRDGDTACVAVSNTGSTIPEEERERIFGKFYQIDRSRSSSGYGVGLALVKKIVVLHGGTVSASSDDTKTTFTVLLPVRH